jgi:transcription antitermination protein NusB
MTGSKRDGRAAREFSARLAAVQAMYQHSQNHQPVARLYDEYIQHRATIETDEEADGQALAQPDGALLRAIMFGVDERRAELESIVSANVRRGAEPAKSPEPLLAAILLCGASELLAAKVDAALVINDYLDVTHTFYGKGEVSLVNGVLDAIAGLLKPAEI